MTADREQARGCVAHGGPDCICPPVCTSEDCPDPTIGHQHPQTAPVAADESGLREQIRRAIEAAQLDGAIPDMSAEDDVRLTDMFVLPVVRASLDQMRAERERLTILLARYEDWGVVNAERANRAVVELAALRGEIADDINRMDLPRFPEGERTDLVVRTTRNICMRIARDGADAPYYQPAGECDPTTGAYQHQPGCPAEAPAVEPPDPERMARVWHAELARLTDPTAVARRELLGGLLDTLDRLRAERDALREQLDAQQTTVEYAFRDGDEIACPPVSEGDRGWAENALARYSRPGAYLVQRLVRRGPWKPAADRTDPETT